MILIQIILPIRAEPINFWSPVKQTNQHIRHKYTIVNFKIKISYFMDIINRCIVFYRSPIIDESPVLRFTPGVGQATCRGNKTPAKSILISSGEVSL